MYSIYTYIYACIHTPTETVMNVCMRARMHARTYKGIHVCTCACMQVHISSAWLSVIHTCIHTCNQALHSSVSKAKFRILSLRFCQSVMLTCPVRTPAFQDIKKRIKFHQNRDRSA